MAVEVALVVVMAGTGSGAFVSMTDEIHGGKPQPMQTQDILQATPRNPKQRKPKLLPLRVAVLEDADEYLNCQPAQARVAWPHEFQKLGEPRKLGRCSLPRVLGRALRANPT